MWQISGGTLHDDDTRALTFDSNGYITSVRIAVSFVSIMMAKTMDRPDRLVMWA